MITGAGIKYRDFVFPGKLEDLSEIMQSVATIPTGPSTVWVANREARWDTLLSESCDLAYTGLMARYLEEEGWTYDLLVPVPTSHEPLPRPPIGHIAHFIWQDRS